MVVVDVVDVIDSDLVYNDRAAGLLDDAAVANVVDMLPESKRVDESSAHSSALVIRFNGTS